jgi:hypothetical protein
MEENEQIKMNKKLWQKNAQTHNPPPPHPHEILDCISRRHVYVAGTWMVLWCDWHRYIPPSGSKWVKSINIIKGYNFRLDIKIPFTSVRRGGNNCPTS